MEDDPVIQEWASCVLTMNDGQLRGLAMAILHHQKADGSVRQPGVPMQDIMDFAEVLKVTAEELNLHAKPEGNA